MASTTGRMVSGTPSLQTWPKTFPMQEYPVQLHIDAEGRCTIGVKVGYHEGQARVILSVKYVVLRPGMPYIEFRKELHACPTPRTKKERQELLRNMATMHAMKLGYPHKLRSKV